VGLMGHNSSYLSIHLYHFEQNGVKREYVYISTCPLIFFVPFSKSIWGATKYNDSGSISIYLLVQENFLTHIDLKYVYQIL